MIIVANFSHTELAAVTFISSPPSHRDPHLADSSLSGPAVAFVLFVLAAIRALSAIPVVFLAPPTIIGATDETTM